MNEQELKLYDDALDLWGEQAQIMMVLEECGELIDAICKRIRGRNELSDVASEVADVQIMCAQMSRLIQRTTNSDLVEIARVEKLQRLFQRVEKAKETKVN